MLDTKLHHKKTMKRYIRPYFLLLAAAMLLLSACANHPDVPSSSKETKSLPAIFPDYCNVTVPCNIAPLNFMLPADEYEACVARFTTPDGQQQTYGSGVKVQIPEGEWHAMLDASKGKSIKVEVWGQKGDEWLSFSPFEIYVAEEPIDEYLSYRLIEPSYVAWTYMEIAQRNLTTFEETQIFNNEITMNDRSKGQCINCHSYQNYKTDNMLFHVRLSNAGTVIVNDGKVSRVNMKRDYTISGGVYPAWHPTAKLVAFSTNRTRQAFHTSNPNKIEVYDEASDMILYDVETDSVSIVSNDSTNTSTTVSLYHCLRRCKVRTSEPPTQKYSTISIAVRLISRHMVLVKRNWYMMQPLLIRASRCHASVPTGATCYLPWVSTVVSIAGTMMLISSVSRWNSILARASLRKPLRPSISPSSTARTIPTAIPPGRAMAIGS